MTDDRTDARLAEILREAREDRFRPGFADRVMRTTAAGREALAPALTGQFLRLAPVALALIAGLFVYNVWVAGSGRPTVESALGLRPVTIEEAVSLDVLLREGAAFEETE